MKRLGIRTVVDIGAARGDVSLDFHKKFPEAKIFAFEPVKSSFLILREKLSKLGDNFITFNLGLGNKNEVIEINKSVIPTASSLLEYNELNKKLFPWTKNICKEKVEIAQLDDILGGELKKNILIKIDAQGYENKIIEGGVRTISKAKIIIIETSFVELFNNQALFDGIYKKLTKLGFRYNGAIEGQLLNLDDGSILQQDSIFIK